MTVLYLNILITLATILVLVVALFGEQPTSNMIALLGAAALLVLCLVNLRNLRVMS